MDLIEAIDHRRSRRKYLGEPLTSDSAAVLRQVAQTAGDQAGVRLELVVDNGLAFAGLWRSYGMFTGVSNYMGLIAKRRNMDQAERLGYAGEIVALTAVTLDLGTCWVGGSFDRKACPFTLAAGESVACVIVVGSVAPDQSLKERVIRGAIHRRTKTAEQLYSADSPVPPWFMSGIQAVQKAPSNTNRQPVSFAYQSGRVTASVPQSSDLGLGVDLGIAKLHFELGAGGGHWQWGNGMAFEPNQR